jgi:hypothetical protein
MQTQQLKFTIRCSAIHNIMAGNIGLTDIQDTKLAELVKRNLDFANKVPGVKPLTDNMTAELKDLTQKRDNPELPTGAKTYCEEWVQCTQAERWPDLNNKYIEKGNLTEEDGFTLMAVQLKLGMVYKNTERRNNGTIQGEWDLLIPGTVIDNKSSWDHVTFPKFKTKMKPEHDWQLQGYMELTGVEKGLLVHTLNDAPEKMLYDKVKWVDDLYQRARIVRNMVYTQKGWERAASLFFDALPLDMYPKFKPIADSDRIKTFSNVRDNIKIGSIYQRVNMCNSYINSLISNN